MQRLHIIGRKNSGKTTLIVDLVEYLTAQGHRVGTVKHTHHRHELDTPGKDSHRHRVAGAVAVGIVAPNLHAVFWPPAGDAETDRYALLEPMFAHCDVVFVEGDMATRARKIEVWRAATGTEPLAATDSTFQAVVSDDAPHVSVPVWPRSDIAALATRVLELVRAKE